MGDQEEDIKKLLEQSVKCINSIDDQWITKWATLIDKYFKQESRIGVKQKAIWSVSQIFLKYHVIYGDELMSKIILPHFSDADRENDFAIRRSILHLFFDITSNCLSYKNCNTMLAIMRRILMKPFLQNQQQLHASGDLQEVHNVASQSVYSIENADMIDSRTIITTLSKLFKTKMHRLPIDPAVNILDISVNYLNLIYRYPVKDPIPAELPMIKRELFSFFLNLRCNKQGHLGVLPENEGATEITYSPFIICVKKPQSSSSSSSGLSNPSRNNHQTNTSSGVPLSPRTEPATVNEFSLPPSTPQATISSSTQQSNNNQQRAHTLSYHQHQQNIFVPNALHPNCPIESRCVNLDLVMVAIIDCITSETDLDVLRLVLDKLPNFLANKPLFLTAGNERVNQLCLALSSLVLPQNRTPNSSTSNPFQATTPIGNQQRQINKDILAQSALRCLTSLLVYRKQLDHRSIKAILTSFEDSLKSLSRHPIVPLFTTCLIELQDSSEMSKFVPVVLQRLIKFSPTLHLGASMLEFLSYLILFPNLYENFSEDEYKFIFAIALPYTNPFRFTDYITCLAFRVIAMWYLKCRPSLRRVFVELVKKSLQSNVIQPFKENYPPLSTNSATAANGSGTTITTPLSTVLGGLLSQTSSPSAQTPPIMHSCPATMSPMDQRKRSSSLNTENSYRHQQIYQTHCASSVPTAQSSLQVNEELIETFADLLSRYTHGHYLAIAPKNRFTEMLLDRSTSQTWLLGNSLITITAGRAKNGWAEILVRRPTGNTSWVGRLQNTIGTLPMLNQQSYMNSLNFGSDIISLFSSLTLTSDNGCDNGTDSLTELSSASISSKDAAISNTLSMDYSSGVGTANSLQSPRDNDSTSSCNSKLKEPTPLPKDKKTDIALSNFDLITPYETHKVGVIYVKENQVNNRVAILSNKYGSPKYLEFLAKIGTCIILNDIDPEVYFTGGLDVKGADGKYSYFWKDNVTQVIFHVATFMLLRENDPHCHGKNRHIGNDHVCIVYNDSGEQFKLSTIKGTGQFILACIVVVPLDDETNSVEVEMLPELRCIVGDIEPRVLSTASAPLYARQMAIHLNLGSKIHERRHCEGFFSKEPYVSNWVERLRCIKRIRQRLGDNRKATVSAAAVGSLSSRASNTLK